MSENINNLDLLSKEEYEQLLGLMTKFIKSYSNKAESQNDTQWLTKEYQSELPQLSFEEAAQMAEETIFGIDEYDKSLKDLNDCCKKGQSKENWVAQTLHKSGTGMSVNDYGNYLQTIDNSITQANTQMNRVITTNSGGISNLSNLDGFIAEQQHVNDFNMNATLKKSGYYAEVCSPESGQTYGKNSFDVVIKDKAGKIVQQYQMKYGANAKATIQLIKKGNYNNQRIVVPPEQLEEVKKAFPNKTIVSTIGGDKVPVSSNGVSKEDAKKLQKKAQKEKTTPSVDWNSFKAKDVALHIGKNAAVAGVQSSLISTGFSMANQLFSEKKIDVDKTVEVAIKSGADAGVKAAISGAVKVGAEKGIISCIPKGTPAGIIANVVSVGVENVKILWKVAKGDMTLSQGVDNMGRTSSAMVAGLVGSAKGAVIGAAALSWIPVVGPAVGGFIGGTIGYMASSKVGEAVYEVAKKVKEVSKNLIKSAWQDVKTVGNRFKNFFFR